MGGCSLCLIKGGNAYEEILAVTNEVIRSNRTVFAPHIMFHSELKLIISNYYLSMSCQHFSLQALIEISAKHSKGMNMVRLLLIEFVCGKTIPTMTGTGLWLIVESRQLKRMFLTTES